MWPLFRKILFVGIIIVISAAAGYFIAKAKFQTQLYIRAMRSGQNGLINPLFEYEIGQNVFAPEMEVLEKKVRTLRDSLIKTKQADTISIYFRSLNDGPWFGIDQDEDYFPASLLKVPLMIAYLKKAETDPKVLDKKITYGQEYQQLGDFNQDQYYKSQKTIQPGQTYTIAELLEYMIKYSDNNAKNLLVLNLDNPEELFQVYTDLGMATPPELRGNGDVLSTHEYATFFRVLYNASYLNRNMSKKTLALLTETDFNKGISSPVPANIQVAHKFGEHSDDAFRQLHDCGIVYYPQKPYILCVMTRGNDFSKLEDVIKQISKTVYEGVGKASQQATP